MMTDQLITLESQLPSCGEFTVPTAYFHALVEEHTGVHLCSDTPAKVIRNIIHTFEVSLQEEIARGGLEESEYPLRHFFSPGLYTREITIPAGHFVVGRLHKEEHLTFLSKGRVTLLTEGGGLEELVAPATIISPAGCKRLLLTHEEVVWSVVIPTELKVVKEIEAEVIAETYSEISMEEPVRLSSALPLRMANVGLKGE